MALEIEHKYLVKNSSFREMARSSVSLRQGYLSRDPERTVRVRIMDDRAFLTVKGKTCGSTRPEFEYEVPVADAERLLALCLPPVIVKMRYRVPYAGHIWEVDEFGAAREGLVTAEIELRSEDESYALPPFVGENVTGNPIYYNSNL